MAMLAWAGCGAEDGMPSEVCHAAPSDVGTLGWERLPEDGKWYVLQRGVVCCMDAFGGTTAWPNLAAGAKGWKADMRAPAENFARLLRQFGAEIHCSLCTIQSASSWDSHCSSDKHFKEVYEVVEQCREVAREELWQQVSVLGGTLKYNHLDGEVQARRTALEPTLSITRLEDLQHTEGWVRVGQIACVSTTPASLKDDWPNLWSLRHWKEKMEPVVTRAMRVLEANQDPYSLRCMICPDQSFSREHLLGPKHYSQLVQVIHDKHRDVVNRDQFWQQWICQCGAVAFNHIDGCCNMVSKPSSSASSSLAKDAHHDNSSQRTSAGSPSPSLDTGGTSSFDGEAAAEAYHYANPGQKPCPSLPGASTPVATTPSFTNHRNVDHNRRPPPPPPGSPPPVSANDMQSCEGQLPRQESLSLSSWLWRKHVGSKASLLASRLSAAGVPRVEHVCAICQRLPPEGLAVHIAEDPHHLSKVEKLMLCEGPESRSWMQTWSGVARFNHLSLELLDDSTPAAAPRSASLVSNASGRGVWTSYKDPESGATWWFNEQTKEASWNPRAP